MFVCKQGNSHMLFYLYEREYNQHMPAVVFACTLGTVEDVETYLVCFRGGEITADCGNDFSDTL